MSKMAKGASTARPRGATATLEGPSTRTHEGGQGWSLDAKTELFTLATTGFFGEDTFYEKAAQRDSRFVALVHQVTQTDPWWMSKFIPWLRDEANMRTVAVVAAVEYARSAPQGEPVAAIRDPYLSGREMIRTTLLRADEPAEALAYHLMQYGKPKAYAVKRGIADAAVKLYNEFSVTKYNSKGHNVRAADVIELCHPKPVNDLQSALFRYVLDERHGRDPEVPESLLQMQDLAHWRKAPTLDRLPSLITWENLSSFYTMDAAAWEAVVPKMGYMALLRNLRNFEQAGVDPRVLTYVANKLSDPEQVTRSRQLPFRFMSAYNQLHTDRFKFPLSQALDVAVGNIPYFGGKTLVLIDTSGSMYGMSMSPKGTVYPVHLAALFGFSVGMRSQEAGVYMFASGCAAVLRSGSVLRDVEGMNSLVNAVGSGTQIWPSLAAALRDYGKPDRVFIFTDMQAHPARSDADSLLPRSVPIHVWDLGGHGKASLELGSGRYLHAGLSDQSFKVVKMLEEYKEGVWPWEA